jgi:Outer membrane protein beta-barrel domain
MKRYIYSLGAVLLLGGCLPAVAQVYYGPGLPVHWYVDGGYSVATGQTSNYLDNGWNLGGGVEWTPTPGPFSLRADLNFSRYDATHQLLAEGEQQNQTEIDDGWADIFTFDLDGVFHIPLGGGVNAYLMAGGGGAWRRIDLTQRVGFGGYYCDGWIGYCSGGYFGGNALVSRDTTTRWEWNAGAGINFPLYGGQSWFIEAKYTQMQTPVPTAFIPIRVGYRF